MLCTVALRNIFRQKRRSILTLLTMAGGLALAVVAIGWSDGTYSYIINMFTRNRLGHLQIHQRDYWKKPSLYDTINGYDAVGGKAAAVRGVQAWAPRLYAAGLASAGDKSAGARIIGIDPARENAATRFDRKIVEGVSFAQAPPRAVILGAELARILNARIGQEAVILSQAADGSMANGLYTVAGFAKSGDAATDRTAFYLRIGEAQELLALPGQAHEIILIVDRIGRVRQLAAAVARALDDPSLSVVPWQEFAKSFYQAMRADQQGSAIQLFVIALIVAVGVLNTVLMAVLERRREYGLLKAVGTRPRAIVALVLCEVAILAVCSVAVGALAGSLANWYLSIHGLRFGRGFTYGGVDFSVLYAEVNARSIYIPSITVLLTAVLVSVFPAIMAARTDPARAMRTQ